MERAREEDEAQKILLIFLDSNETEWMDIGFFDLISVSFGFSRNLISVSNIVLKLANKPTFGEERERD